MGEAWLPTDRGTALLRAALLPDPGGPWAELRHAGLDLDSASHEEQRLLPRVHENLRRAGVDDPDMARMKGVRRRAWASNQRRVRRAADVVERLTAAGVPSMALKGLPLAITYLDDLGLRPMADIDLLVPPDHAPHAAAVLIEGGLVADPRRRRPFHTAWAFADAEIEIDLHWRLHIGLVPPVPGSGSRSAGSVSAGSAHAPGGARGRWGGGTVSVEALVAADRSTDEWAHAEPLAIGAASTLQPDPTSLLFHTVVHGAGAGSNAGLRWAADAWTILDRRGIDVSWERFAARADGAQVGPLLGEALQWLAASLDAAVPAGVPASLRRQTPTRRAALATRWRLDPPRSRVLGGLPATLGKYLALTAGQRPLTAARGVAGYLADEWEIDGARQLAPWAVAKARGRFSPSARRPAVDPATP